MLNRNAKLCIIALFLPVSLITQAESTTILENKSSQLQNTTTNQPVDWQTYEDGEHGYKIQYPQEWKTYEEDFPLMSSAGSFRISPDNNPEELSLDRTSVLVTVENVTRTLDPATLKVQALSPEQHANDLISGMTSAKGTPNILKNEAITFSGQPAWRVDFIHNYLGVQAGYGIVIYVVKDQNLYEISFNTNPLKVEEMRPAGEKIIQTFQFFNNTGQKLDQQDIQKAENAFAQSGKNKPLESKNISDCEESYPDACITTDVDCSDLQERNFEVTGSDPNNLDPDGDGIACEE